MPGICQPCIMSTTFGLGRILPQHSLAFVMRYVTFQVPVQSPPHPCLLCTHQQEVGTSLQANAQRVTHSANCSWHPAPSFQTDQWVWLAKKSGRLRSLGGSTLVMYHLALPCKMRINPTFHVSCLKPVLCSPMTALW